MKSITIHGLDEPLYDLIRLKARADGLTINQAIHRLLGEALGVRPRGRGSKGRAPKRPYASPRVRIGVEHGAPSFCTPLLEDWR